MTCPRYDLRYEEFNENRIKEQHWLRFQVSNVSGTFAETLASGGKDQAVQRNYNEFFLQYQFNFGPLAQHQH